MKDENHANAPGGEMREIERAGRVRSWGGGGMGGWRTSSSRSDDLPVSLW